MTTRGTVTIANLAEFRRDLQRATSTSPRLLTMGLKRAGVPVVARSRSVAPRLTGRLAGGYKTSVRGATAYIVNAQPYAGGAEWGSRGRWSGFARYGPPGQRTAGRAIDELEDVIAETVYREISDLVTILGWAR